MMNKENKIKLGMLLGSLGLFLGASRFAAEGRKVECIDGVCKKTHAYGEFNFIERFPVQKTDNFLMAVVKSCANFWEANATGMTFAIIIGAAALSLLLSWKKLEEVFAFKGIKGAALGSVFGMPLNMCANCSAVAGVGMTSQGGSAEATLGVILGGALLNIVGIVTMFGIFDPIVVISRLLFSAFMILVVVPFVAKYVQKSSPEKPRSEVFNMISCYFPEKSFVQTMVKATEDWLIAVGNIAYKLIPLMMLGTLVTAIFRVVFSNETLHHFTTYNPIVIIVVMSFIGTMLSIPVLFEILLGTVLFQLGFSNGAIAAMVFTAPSFGLFTMVLTKEKLGGYKVPLLMILITFLCGIGAGLFAEYLS